MKLYTCYQRQSSQFREHRLVFDVEGNDSSRHFDHDDHAAEIEDVAKELREDRSINADPEEAKDVRDLQERFVDFLESDAQLTVDEINVLSLSLQKIANEEGIEIPEILKTNSEAWIKLALDAGFIRHEDLINLPSPNKNATEVIDVQIIRSIQSRILQKQQELLAARREFIAKRRRGENRANHINRLKMDIIDLNDELWRASNGTLGMRKRGGFVGSETYNDRESPPDAATIERRAERDAEVRDYLRSLRNLPLAQKRLGLQYYRQLKRELPDRIPANYYTDIGLIASSGAPVDASVAAGSQAGDYESPPPVPYPERPGRNVEVNQPRWITCAYLVPGAVFNGQSGTARMQHPQDARRTVTIEVRKTWFPSGTGNRTSARFMAHEIQASIQRDGAHVRTLEGEEVVLPLTAGGSIDNRFFYGSTGSPSGVDYGSNASSYDYSGRPLTIEEADARYRQANMDYSTAGSGPASALAGLRQEYARQDRRLAHERWLAESRARFENRQFERRTASYQLDPALEAESRANKRALGIPENMTLRDWQIRMRALTRLAQTQARDKYVRFEEYSKNGWEYQYDTKNNVLYSHYFKDPTLNQYRYLDRNLLWKDAGQPQAAPTE